MSGIIFLEDTMRTRVLIILGIVAVFALGWIIFHALPVSETITLQVSQKESRAELTIRCSSEDVTSLVFTLTPSDGVVFEALLSSGPDGITRVVREKTNVLEVFISSNERLSGVICQLAYSVASGANASFTITEVVSLDSKGNQVELDVVFK